MFVLVEIVVVWPAIVDSFMLKVLLERLDLESKTSSNVPSIFLKPSFDL